MNVAELKQLLEDADDEAEVLFLAFDEACDDGDAGTLEPLGVADLEEDADGNPVFALCLEDEDDEDEEDDEGEDAPGEEAEDDMPGSDR